MLTIHLRPVNARFLGLGAFLTFALLILVARPSPSSFRLPEGLFSQPRRRASCAPSDYAAGEWRLRDPARHPANVTSMQQPSDALTFSGFEGCASNREFLWHLAADNEGQYSRFPAAHDWEWVPGEGCKDFAPFSAEQMVKDLVEQGGWLLLGDSVSENHFFSLSCLLYPHVRATPNYTDGSSFDRAWPQNLYLSPTSPLLARTDNRLVLPPHFDIASTPLVTFRRNDLLLGAPELEALYPGVPAYNSSRKLLSAEQSWLISPDEYLPWFTAPRPAGAGYSTLVVSTGGHWTTTLLAAFREAEGAEPGSGIRDVLAFFRGAMATWAERVQAAVAAAVEEQAAASSRERRGAMKRQVIVRAYLPGHEGCHDQRSPWTEIQPWIERPYNWAEIEDFNTAFEDAVSNSPDIHYLGIDRPARLRPDAHSTQDCLHFMTGTGVMEGWTYYIWHYISRELVGRIR